MFTLGIETTCDETAAAVVQDGKKILSSVVSSQIDIHEHFGGVVPELACRRHIELIIPVIDQALSESGLTLSDIDLIAAARGPGLIGALMIGLNVAKTLALATSLPFIGVNHVEAHLYAAWMSAEEPVDFPCLGIVLSGGHTLLLIVHEIGKYTVIGQTVDDAIGEAFDKVAKMLNLPYPGGPEIEKHSLTGDQDRFPFKGGKVKGRPYEFSFSGLKTAVLYQLQKMPPLSPKDCSDIAASFQHAALTDVLQKAKRASENFNLKTILFGGGVTNNQTLRSLFEKQAPDCRCVWPTGHLTLDNAAMIAGLGTQQYIRDGKSHPLDLEPLTRIPLR